MKIKGIIKKLGKKILLRIKPKRSLPENTIFINRDTWPSFDSSDFSEQGDSKYTFVCDKIERVHKKSLKNISAYLGVIDKRYLKFMSSLEWLQIASHGFNGFDESCLYNKKASLTITNMRDVFSTPIAQYCITAYYMFNNYALRNICGGGIA